MRQRNIIKIMSFMFIMGLTSACAVEPRTRENLHLSGNTFSLYNELGKMIPNDTRVNISYEFQFKSKTILTLGEVYSGPSWLFEEWSAQHPDKTIQLHMHSPVSEPMEYAEDEGEIKSLGRFDFKVVNYCLNTDHLAAIDPQIRLYIDHINAEKIPLSRYVIMRRYMSERLEDDGSRLDIIYVEDITRQGYSCKDIGDINEPKNGTGVLIERINERADRTFEFIG
jgi:hypothetical protein